jgi:hypothetical protein
LRCNSVEISQQKLALTFQERGVFHWAPA